MNTQHTSGKRRVQDRIHEMLHSNDPTAGTEYFIDSFTTEAMLALSRMRRKAGLTQDEVARRMNTKQPAIARWESDLSGKISLEHYARFAAACGVLPFDLTFVSIGNLRAYALADPDAPRTAEAYWRFVNTQSVLSAGNTVGAQPQTTASRSGNRLTAQEQPTARESQHSMHPSYGHSQRSEHQPLPFSQAVVA